MTYDILQLIVGLFELFLQVLALYVNIVQSLRLGPRGVTGMQKSESLTFLPNDVISSSSAFCCDVCCRSISALGCWTNLESVKLVLFPVSPVFPAPLLVYSLAHSTCVGPRERETSAAAAIPRDGSCTHIFPTPLYILPSCGTVLSSRIVNSKIFLSFSLLWIWDRTTE